MDEGGLTFGEREALAITTRNPAAPDTAKKSWPKPVSCAPISPPGLKKYIRVRFALAFGERDR